MPDTRIQITFEAKDAASGVIRGITSQFGQLGQVFDALTEKDIRWGNVAQIATEMVVKGLEDSVKATLEYADQVRALSEVSGQSTEDTSRFIQVLDDYKISAEDALAATRALTKQGLSPTIDTLAQLSDKYLAINNAEDRNAFILKNLGRSGLEWVDVLKQGSAAIKEQGAAVEGSLILSEKQVEAARMNEIATDRWNDAVHGLQVTIGNQLLPVLTEFANSLLDNAAAMELAHAAGEKNIPTYVLVAKGYSETAVKARELHDAAMASASGLDAAGQSANGLNKDFEKTIGLAQQIGGATVENLKKAAFAALQLKLAADGTLSADDEATLEKAGVALGIFSQRALGDSEAVLKLNSDLAAGIITIKQYTDALNKIPTDINTNVSTTFTNPLGGGGSGASSGPVHHSKGADFIVPSGYPNDSYPMLVESGEHVIVVPKDQVNQPSPGSGSPGGSSQVLQNHGVINIYLKGDEITVRHFMAELGAAM